MAEVLEANWLCTFPASDTFMISKRKSVVNAQFANTEEINIVEKRIFVPCSQDAESRSLKPWSYVSSMFSLRLFVQYVKLVRKFSRFFKEFILELVDKSNHR